MYAYIPLGLYKKKLKLRSKEAVCLTNILKPFNIPIDDMRSDENLSIALLLDELSERYYSFECITPLVLIKTASELGFKPAEEFLKTGPFLIRHRKHL